jgi:hypothetical protein
MARLSSTIILGQISSRLQNAILPFNHLLTLPERQHQFRALSIQQTKISGI